MSWHPTIPVSVEAVCRAEDGSLTGQVVKGMEKVSISLTVSRYRMIIARALERVRKTQAKEIPGVGTEAHR
jgi:hypothetical protein